jgi:hypothetical protein
MSGIDNVSTLRNSSNEIQPNKSTEQKWTDIRTSRKDKFEAMRERAKKVMREDKISLVNKSHVDVKDGLSKVRDRLDASMGKPKKQKKRTLKNTN